MKADLIAIDDQPVSPSFFGEGRWLTDYITPAAPDIRRLSRELSDRVAHYRSPGVPGYDAPHREGYPREDETLRDRVAACWGWVASQVRYVPYVHAVLSVEGVTAEASDLWMTPSMTARVRVGNCVNKSFLLASLIRNFMAAPAVWVAMGNLHQNAQVSGHAWVEADIGGKTYILESTRDDMNPFVPARLASIYEAVLYVNDAEVRAVPGKTALLPFSAVYADWLKEYLDWVYIEGRK